MTSPVLNGRLIGETENAIRAVMDRLLDSVDTTFHQWVVLNGATLAGGEARPDEILDRAARGLKVDQVVLRDALGELAAAGLVHVGSGAVQVTDAGRERHGRIRSGVDDVTSRFYGDIPQGDLDAAARVLDTVRTRADMELAAM